MNMLFLYLYPLVGFISILAFVPQIKVLLKAKASPVNFSTHSWMLWSFTSFINLGYGFYILEDLMFCIIGSISLCLNLVVLLLVLYRKFITFGSFHNFYDLVLEFFCRAPYLGLCETRIKMP